ncbi:MAG: J domain-containing protein [Spirochaetales bacterium]|nr:J domain-containing protein [Spirochaetales bacterium]
MKLDRFKKPLLRHAGLIAGSVLGLLSGLHLFGLAVGALLGYFADELAFSRKILKRGASLMENPAVGVLDDRWTRIILSVTLAYTVAVTSTKEGKIGLGEQKLLEDRILRALGIDGREGGLVRQLTDRFFSVRTIHPAGLVSVYREISTQDDRCNLLELLFDAAAGENGRITAGQNDLLKTVSIGFEIPAENYNDLRRKWISIDHEAYEIIGLSPEAGDREIHRVYRRLASQFHPDTGGDLDETQRKQSNEAFLKIQDAYNRIIADRNALRMDNDDPGDPD